MLLNSGLANSRHQSGQSGFRFIFNYLWGYRGSVVGGANGDQEQQQMRYSETGVASTATPVDFMCLNLLTFSNTDLILWRLSSPKRKKYLNFCGIFKIQRSLLY